MSELVTGSSQNHEPLLRVAAVQLVHLGVIPDCCASNRRYILNKHNFSLQGGEIQHLPGQKFSGQIVELLDSACHAHPRRLQSI